MSACVLSEWSSACILRALAWYRRSLRVDAVPGPARVRGRLWRWALTAVVVCSLVTSPVRAAEVPAVGVETDTPDETQAADKRRFRIAALYHGPSETGKRQLKGTMDAIEAHRAGNKDRSVECVEKPYFDTDGAAAAMRSLLEEDKVDVIIGPTNSGDFVHAQRDHESFAQARVPMVSPLVTIDLPILRKTWLFRANVDVDRRVTQLVALLRQENVSSVAVIFENTDYG